MLIVVSVECRDLTAKCREIGRKIIADRRAEGAKDESFLDLLLQAYDDTTDSRFTDKEVLDNVITFLSAGTDTTALSMMWIIVNVLRNPEVKKKIEAEVDAFFSNKTYKDYSPEESDTAFPYFRKCLFESIRLTPSASAGAPRQSKMDMVIGGYHFPKGVRSIHILSDLPSLSLNLLFLLSTPAPGPQLMHTNHSELHSSVPFPPPSFPYR